MFLFPITMPGNDIHYQLKLPEANIASFVESFWMLENHSEVNKEIVLLPDGRIDLFFTHSPTEPFHVLLLGLSTQPERGVIPAGKLIFAISFKLLATEYLLHNTVSQLLDGAKNLPVDFWGFNANDLHDFNLFCERASRKIQSLLPYEIDNRKRQLFDLIYTSNGGLTVGALSEKVFWSSRQINRYFNQQYGVSLKAYCNILRFRASFQHIKDGKLFPEQEFADQSHFIKEIKKLSGVLPKDLSKNHDGRFIQFSTLRG